MPVSQVERSIHCFWFVSRSRTTAVSSLWLLFAQRQMLVNGAINVLPSLVNEYSTAMDFDLVTRLAINPVDSRLRRVLVRIRCETLPRRRRSSPCLWGRSLSEDKILAVHLPMKIVETVFDSGLSSFFILLQPAVKLFERDNRRKAALHTSVSVVRHLGTLPVLLPLPQVGTQVYLLDRDRKQSDTRTRFKVPSVET